MVVGPAAQLGRALALVQAAAVLDGAVLDINLNGQFCFPAAAALLARSVPFIFLTGYDNRGIIPAEFAAAPVLPKSIDEGALIAIGAATFGSGGGDGGT